MANPHALLRMNATPLDPCPVTDLDRAATVKISESLRALLADAFTLYMKTRNFYWHVRGPHFRDYRALFDQHAREILAMTDALAERTRKIGGSALRSIGDILRHQTLHDNEREAVTYWDMLKDLRADNREFAAALRTMYVECENHRDVGTAGLIEQWMDETEGRVWHLTDIARDY
jgi:starvation-inducible DNA-binding protein